MVRIDPKFRINACESGLFSIFCDSFKNTEHNIIDGQFVMKPPKDSPHQDFAHFCSSEVCRHCYNFECNLRYSPSIFGKSSDSGTEMEVCQCCLTHYLSKGFTIIFELLVEAKLLSKDYKPVCCYCYRAGYEERSDIPHEFLNHR